MNPTRRKSPQAPTCESLEGRQLLAAGAGADLGMGMGISPMGPGGPADVSTTGLGNAPSGQWSPQGNWSQGSAGMAQDRLARPMMQDASLDAASTVNVDGQGLQNVRFGRGGTGAVGDPSTFRGPAGAVDSAGLGGTAGLAFHGDLTPSGNVGDWAHSTTSGAFGESDHFTISGMMVPGLGPVGGSSAGSTQIQADLEKLQADQQAIHDKSNVTPAMEAKVRNDIKAIKGAETTTPDATATATLQADIKTAMANVGGPTEAQLDQIQADQAAIYKSQGVSDGLINLLTTDQQAIKTAAGVTDADRSTIAADQKAIDADRAALAPPAQAAATTGASPDAATLTATSTDPNAVTTTTLTTADASPVTTADATPATTAVTTTATDGASAAAAAAPVAPPAVPATPAVPVTPQKPVTMAQAVVGRHVITHAVNQHAGVIGRSIRRRR